MTLRLCLERDDSNAVSANGDLRATRRLPLSGAFFQETEPPPRPLQSRKQSHAAICGPHDNALPVSAPPPPSKGVHGGGRDVPSGGDQGDQPDQGPQAAPHAPVAGVEARAPPPPAARQSAALAPRTTPTHMLPLLRRGPPPRWVR